MKEISCKLLVIGGGPGGYIAAIRAGQPLADAALVSGFADQSHLTRQFGRAFGLTPGRWRAMHRPG